MNKILIGVVILVVVIFSGISLLAPKSSAPIVVPSQPGQPMMNNSAMPNVQTDTSGMMHMGGGYTMAEVSKHNSVSSCWSVVSGSVYDLTPWIFQHPGGPDAILFLCGIDGTSAFNDQHGGQRRPERELEGFLIGKLSAN